jgi:hypothetical protein
MAYRIGVYNMTITVGGGGGVFVPTFASGGLLLSLSGLSGTILTLTPPSNQRVRLNVLVASADVPGISIYIDNIQGAPIINNKILGSNSAGIDSFLIAGTSTSTSLTSQVGCLPPMVIGVDESIIIFLGSTTTQQISYGYEFGVLR